MARWRKGWMLAVGMLAACSGGQPVTEAAAPELTPYERDVLHWVNVARTEPDRIARMLRLWRGQYEGLLVRRGPDRPLLQTREGVAAVDEAIAALERQAPVPPLTSLPCLAVAAGDHVRDQGPTGATGHDGSDGSAPVVRMRRHCQVELPAGENIHYGDGPADEVVLALIIDDGVPQRGHRTSLYYPDFRVVGIGVGAHARYRSMTVMDFAKGSR